jgi:2',3'-cyclic-nucleotide 2'-phosphodiesterase / 3'-nucleotidase
MAEGVEYEVDLTGPAGDRIRNLRFQGEPLAPDRKLRIAINNYRAAGSAGYSMFAGAPVVWRSGQEIRDLMVDYYTARKALPVASSGNWRVVPELAAKTLAREALTAAGHQGNQ